MPETETRVWGQAQMQWQHWVHIPELERSWVHISGLTWGLQDHVWGCYLSRVDRGVGMPTFSSLLSLSLEEINDFIKENLDINPKFVIPTYWFYDLEQITLNCDAYEFSDCNIEMFITTVIFQGL